MSTVVKTWSWDSNIDGWVDHGLGVPSFSYDSSDHSVKFTGTVSADNTVTNDGRSATGVTWETLGVPVGATVTGVQITGWKRKVVAHTNISNWALRAYMVDSGGSNIFGVGTYLKSLSLPLTNDSVYTALTTGSSISPTPTYVASSTAVRMVLEMEITSSPSGSATADCRLDDVQITISYTGGAGTNTDVNPSVGHVTVSGHALGLITNPHSFLWTWTSDIDGWADRGLDSNVSVSWVTPGYGGAGGCLSFHYSGTVADFNEQAWSRDGETWETWGIPPGAQVIAVSVVGFRRKVSSIGSFSIHHINPVRILNGTTSVTVADLLNGVLEYLPLTAGDWIASSNTGLGSTVEVAFAYRSSNTAVRLVIEYFGTIITGSGTQASTVNIDDVELAITYVPLGNVWATPVVAHVVVAGHTPGVVMANRVTPGCGHAVATGRPGVITFGSSVVAQPQAGHLGAAGHPAGLVVSDLHWLSPGPGRLTIGSGSPGVIVSRPGFTVIIGGVDRTEYIDNPAGTRLLDSRNASRSDLSFSVQAWKGWRPQESMRVTVSDGPETFFAGRISLVRTARHLKDGNLVWYYDCTVTGNSVLLTKTEPIFAHYKSIIDPTPVTITVAQVLADILGYLPNGFTANHTSVSGTITEISFDGVSVDAALRQLAQSVGALYYVDESDDVHFYMDADPGMTAPDVITEDNCRDASLTADASQVVTRQYVRGYATSVVSVSPGTLVLANGAGMDDAGLLIVGTEQRVTYSNREEFPTPGAVLATLAYNARGGGYGAAQTILFVGRNATRAQVQTLAAHGLAVGCMVKISGTTPTDYNGLWRITRVTSPWTFEFEVTGTPGSGGGGMAVAATSGDINDPATAFFYAVTFAVNGGETLPGAVSLPMFVNGAIVPPSSMGSGGQTTGGSMGVGTYYYSMSFETSMGETAANFPMGSAVLTGGNNAFQFYALPTGADERVLRRKIYRTKLSAPTTFFLCATLDDNTTTTFTDTLADSSLGAQTALTEYRAGYGAVNLTAIPTCPFGVAAATRRIYRAHGSGRFYLAGTIDNNTDTTWCDTQPDSALGALAPVVSTAPVQVTIPSSGPGAPVSPIAAGDAASIVVRCDDVPAQLALAAIDGSDGIRVGPMIVDAGLSADACRVRGNAELAIRSRAENRFECVCLDSKIRAGQTVTVNINGGSGLFSPGWASPGLGSAGDAPIAGVFRILSCEIVGYDLGPTAQITRKIVASDLRFTPADLLAQWEATTNWRPMGYTGVAVY